MSRTSDIEAALRALDAADHRVDAGNARALADLQSILATDPAPDLLQRPCSPSAARRSRPANGARSTRKLALAVGVLAAVTAGVVALPSLSGGDQAFASWTPAPDGLSAQERGEAADGCRRRQQDGAGADYVARLSTAQPVIAERRGAWTTVVLAGSDGFSAMCISDDSSPFFARDAIGSVGTRTGYAPPGPRDLAADSLGVGTTNAGDLSLAAGTAGSDIVRVVYRSRTHGKVAATLSQGHFALWLPGNELRTASSNGVELALTYRDGSTGSSRLTL